MHARKTGALIRAAATLGALGVGAAARHDRAVDEYARELGLAFQIIDDVLDVEGSTAALGKTAGKDAAAGKPTFPALYGVTGSRALAADCVAAPKRRSRRPGSPAGSAISRLDARSPSVTPAAAPACLIDAAVRVSWASADRIVAHIGHHDRHVPDVDALVVTDDRTR